MNDLFGQFKWDRVPLITQNINGTFAGNTFNSGASAIISGVNRYQSLTLDLKPKLRVGLDYETRFGSAAISLRHANYYLALSSQSLKLNESRALGIRRA